VIEAIEEEVQSSDSSAGLRRRLELPSSERDLHFLEVFNLLFNFHELFLGSPLHLTSPQSDFAVTRMAMN
jgi:hypothetical protein